MRGGNSNARGEWRALQLVEGLEHEIEITFNITFKVIRSEFNVC